MRKILLLIAIMLPAVLGCGIMDRVQKAVESNTATVSNANSLIVNTNSNQTLTDKAIDTAVGGQKIGIQECDEAIDILEAQANDPNDNFVTKAIKKTALNTFRDQLKQQLEQNQANKAEIAKFCKEFRDNMASGTKDANSNTGH